MGGAVVQPVVQTPRMGRRRAPVSRGGRHLSDGDVRAQLAGFGVGRNAVVGANCVVREDVPPRTVVAGDPARIVRQWVDGRWAFVD